MTPVSLIIAGAFILSFSLSTFIGYMIDLYRLISIRANGFESKGLVKGLIYDDNEKLACRLLVEYRAINGKTYQVETSVGTAFWSKYENQYIDIIYNQNNPEIVFIKKEMKFRFGFLLIFNFLWTLTGVFCLFYGLYKLLLE
ncbi:MAG: hypothetical protein JW917_02990 [Ignavibacteria bacterium]|nr:hypothetical protein [Ignavibacteria bacterium]